MTRTAAGVLALLLAVAACSADRPDPSPLVPLPGSSSAAAPDRTTPPRTTPPATSPPATAFDAGAAARTVRRLAAGGPREATSAAFAAAAEDVAARLESLGYDVRRERFRVPSGESWGVPVPAGRTVNVVAAPPGRRAGAYVLVGAHLDTVPQSPGAEDNASGVAVLLELARLARELPTRVPVTFVAFGAEEPRGPGDDEHHFGSMRHSDRLGRLGTAPLRGMVSLDRVGRPGPVRVCTGGISPLRVARELVAAADRAGVSARRCENRTSDHWPFEKAGETVARVGGTDYAAYHSARDLPRVVSRRQLDRVGRVLWEWLRAP